jgi:dihydrofolate reductase
MDKNGVIGLNGELPWHIPTDLAYFKSLTEGSTIVMGRKTYESIGRPLPNRTNVIITRDDSLTEEYGKDGCYVAHSVDEFISEWNRDDEEVFVIGGAEIYRKFLPYAETLYITHIDHEFKGDTYFPYYDSSKFEQVSLSCVEANGQTPYDLKFAIYDSIK